MTSRSRTLRINIVGDARDVQQMFSGVGRAAGGLTGSLGRLAGVAGVAGAVLALQRLGRQSFRLAADFEESFAKIEGLVGISRDQLQSWRSELLAMGPEVGKAPQELADALFFVTSAGLRGEAALRALRASARASAAGLGATQDVAFAAASAMNAYGEANLTAEQAVDILTNTVRQGNVEAATLAPVLGNVIPIAAELGVSFDQVGGALAAMTRLGVDAATSATSLRQILATLLKPTSQAEQELNKFGLSAAGLREQLRERGLLDVLLTLRERFGDNEEAISRVFPNVRALSGVLNLVGENAGAAQQIFAELANSTGIADDAFAAMAETGNFKLRQAMAELQVLGIGVGERMMPAVTAAAQAVVPVFAALANVAGMLLTALGPIVATLAALIGALAPLVGTIGPVVAAAILATKAFAGLVVAGKALLGVLMAIRTGGFFVGLAMAMGKLVAAINPVTVAFAVAIGVVTLWNRRQQEARQRAEEFRAALDDETGAITGNTRAWLLNELGQRGHLAVLNEAGVKIVDVERALRGEAGALDFVFQRLDEAWHAREIDNVQRERAKHAIRELVRAYEDEQAAIEERSVALEDSTASFDRHIDATDKAAAIWAESARRQEELTAASEAETAARDALGSVLDEQADQYRTLAQRMQDAATEQRSLAGAVREHLDPMLSAIRSNERLISAEERLSKAREDGKSSAAELRAMELEVHALRLESQVASEDLALAYGTVDNAVDELAVSMGTTRQAAREMLEDLGLIQDGKWTARISVRVPSFGWNQTPGSNTLIPFEGPPRVFQRGGVARARPGGVFSQIAEAGSDEAVIPLNERGMAFLIEALARALGASGLLGKGGSSPAKPTEVTVIVELDGRTIAQAAAGPLVDLIRVKTGTRV